jgi:hypothetical protein
MSARKIRVGAGLVTACAAAVGAAASHGQVVAPSTWAANIVIDPQPRNPDGTPMGSPSAAAFDDWNDIPLALTDPDDNPGELNLIDIKDVKIANDANFIYLYASGHRMRTNGVYLAFDADQDVGTGYNVFGLNLVGSELGYVNDFVFDQRAPGIFNDNKTNGLPDPGGSCCTGGPLDVNNGGAAIYPGWDVEFAEREWAIPLDAQWSANEPFGPTFPNPTFNFILWTDQGISDVTDAITYTLAAPPTVSGDFDGDQDVDGADFLVWQRNLGATSGATTAHGDATGDGAVNGADLAIWKTNFGRAPLVASARLAPEPGSTCAVAFALAALGAMRRRR